MARFRFDANKKAQEVEDSEIDQLYQEVQEAGREQRENERNRIFALTQNILSTQGARDTDKLLKYYAEKIQNVETVLTQLRSEIEKVNETLTARQSYCKELENNKENNIVIYRSKKDEIKKRQKEFIEQQNPTKQVRDFDQMLTQLRQSYDQAQAAITTAIENVNNEIAELNSRLTSLRVRELSMNNNLEVSKKTFIRYQQLKEKEQVVSDIE